METYPHVGVSKVYLDELDWADGWFHIDYAQQCAVQGIPEARYLLGSKAGYRSIETA